MRSYLLLAASALAMSGIIASAAFAGATASSSRWTIEISGSHERLNDISCATTHDCYVAASNGQVLATHKHGMWNSVRWQLIGHKLTSIRCGSAWHCEVVAPPDTIFTTTDGGGAWTTHKLHLPKTLSKLGRIACPTTQVCFVTATPSGAPDTWFNHSAAIYRTRDGGSTWKPLSIPSNIGCPGECTTGRYHWGYDLQWIACLSAKICRAGGDTFLGEHIGYASAVIVTGNGGRTWRLVHHEFDPTYAACGTPSVCVGVRYMPRTPTVGPEFLRTTDGGATWTMTSHMPALLTSVACSGANFCELVGPHGRVATATGIHLELEQRITASGLDAVSCPRQPTCYAAGNKGTVIVRK